MQLDEYRAQLDEIDKQLLALFEQRMQISKKVALYKKENDLPIFQSQREQEIISTRGSASPPELRSYTEDFFAQIMKISRDYQAEILEENK